MRPFLEQRGVAERWHDGKRVNERRWQIMIDLDDLWSSFSSAADMLAAARRWFSTTCLHRKGPTDV